ncbi:MAG: chaperone modulator CbpM [Rectinemataceae bacterium]
MNRQTAIALSQICDYYHIDIEIVRDFSEFGLYPTVIMDGETGIETKHLEKLEQIISLHRALGINKEGIDVILELRERISGLQEEVEALQNEVEKLKRQVWNVEPDELESRGLLIEIDD